MSIRHMVACSATKIKQIIKGKLLFFLKRTPSDFYRQKSEVVGTHWRCITGVPTVTLAALKVQGFVFTFSEWKFAPSSRAGSPFGSSLTTKALRGLHVRVCGEFVDTERVQAWLKLCKTLRV
jgi:hypothetical protein